MRSAAQPLGQAITQLATQNGILIGVAASLVAGKQAPELNDRYTPEQALVHLLTGSGLVAVETAPGRYSVMPAQEAGKPAGDAEGKPAGPVPMPVVTVTDHLDSDSPHNTRYLHTNSITATKTNTPIMQTPFSVQVVSRQVLQDQQAIRLETALQNVSGVVQMASNQGGSDSFVMRGFNSNTIYRNGVFMPDSLGGGTTKREMANVERVEVLKGPGSILFGRADPGGIINTVTKQPLATPYYSAQQQFGSFNTYRTTVDATGPLTKDGTLLYRVNLSYENSGSFRDFVNKEAVFIAPVLRLNISPQTLVTAELEYQSFKEMADPGIPNIGNRPANVPRNLFAGEPINNKNHGDRYFAGLNWSHIFSDKWTVSHRLSAELFDYTSNSLFWFTSAAPNGSLTRLFNNSPNNNSNRYQSSVNLTGNISTGTLKHTLLFGYDYIFLDDKIKGANCCAAAPAFNIFSPSYRAAAPVADPANNYNLGFTQSWHGVYFQDQVQLPYNLHAMGGFRYDNAVGRNTQLGQTTSADDRFTPRGGLLWQPVKWASLYGSYTENFGASNSLFNSDGNRLPPQTAQQWEMGLKNEFWDGRLRSTFSYFELTKQGIGVPDPANPMRSRAIGEAQTRGYEFDVTGEIARGWNVIGTYTYMPFASITKDVGFSGLPGDVGNQGNRLFLAPKHYGSLWSTYDFQNIELRGLRLGAGVQGVGQRQGDSGNTYQLPEYVIGNLMASYRIKAGATRVSAQLNVNNVSDERYYAGTNSGNFITVGMPRTFMGSVRIEY